MCRSPQDGTSKMSKSAESDLSRINLLDEPKLIVKKIKSAKTDTFEGLEYDDPERPEARNLMTMYALATGMSMVRPNPRFELLAELPVLLFVPRTEQPPAHARHKCRRR